MASVERTAYPRFKRIVSERELVQFFTPDEAEIAWARSRTRERPEALLTLLVLLKSSARLGYFPDLEQVPGPVVARVRAVAELPGNVVAAAAGRYRAGVREYLGLAHDPARARKIAAAAMEEAAPVRASAVDQCGGGGSINSDGGVGSTPYGPAAPTTASPGNGCDYVLIDPCGSHSSSLTAPAAQSGGVPW